MKTMTPNEPDACTIVTVERQLTAVTRAHVPMNKMPEAQRTMRAKITAALASIDLGPVGANFTLWRPLPGPQLDLEPGTIVSHAFASVGEVVASELPAGRAAHYLLRGGYDKLGDAWGTLFTWCKAQDLKVANLNWEIYRGTDPSSPETALYALLA